MSSIYPSGSIFQCAHCRCTVVKYGTTLYEWESGHVHDCEPLTAMVESVIDDVLAGAAPASLLADAVDAWLAERRS